MYQGEAHRQGERAVQEREGDHDRGDDPVVAVADLAGAGGGPVVEPGRGVDLGPAAVKQGVIDRDPHRLSLGHQQAHDQRGKDRGQLLG